PRSASCNGPCPGSPTAASASNGSSRTTAPPTAPTPGDASAPSSPSHPSAQVLTVRRRTGRSSDSIALWPTVGPTFSTTTANQPDAQPCPPGCTSTITTGPTLRSGSSRPSAGSQTTCLGSTASRKLLGGPEGVWLHEIGHR